MEFVDDFLVLKLPDGKKQFIMADFFLRSVISVEEIGSEKCKIIFDSVALPQVVVLESSHEILKLHESLRYEDDEDDDEDQEGD